MTNTSSDRAPVLNRLAFHCPRCGVFATQDWYGVIGRQPAKGPAYSMTAIYGEIMLAVCGACDRPSHWVDGVIVYPHQDVTGPEPHPDMPDDVKGIFEEARAVSTKSPKAGAALLRLALQHLVNYLESGSGDINAKIKRLVARGLDPFVQQAMDTVRIVGNNGVHPGEINLDEDTDWLPHLFDLINSIVEQMITRPKAMTSLYASLPQGAKDAIDKRDAPKT